MRDFPWEDIFKLSASSAASEICEWVQVGIDVYIRHCKYQVKPHSSPSFSAACAAAIVHRNHFFPCTNRTNLLSLKSSSGRLLIDVKDFLELPNLHMLLKQKNPSFSRNLVLGTFGELVIVFLTKVNLIYLLYSVVQWCCLLRVIKQNCFLKTFLRTLIFLSDCNGIQTHNHLVRKQTLGQFGQMVECLFTN